MKRLVVYYSLDGNTRLVARKIAQISDADLLELEPAREVPRGNFMKFFWGGRQVMMKDKPSLKPLHKNPNEYDMIFIGTPVWAWSYTPALATFFDETGLNRKKIALFCCHAGGMGGAFENMAKQLKGNDILGTIDFVEPLKQEKKKIEEEITSWAKAILEKADPVPIS